MPEAPSDLHPERRRPARPYTPAPSPSSTPSGWAYSARTARSSVLPVLTERLPQGLDTVPDPFATGSARLGGGAGSPGPARPGWYD